MLVLIAGSDLDYCARIGESLRRASHEVVSAADLDVARTFLARAAATDAVVVSGSAAEPVPAEFVRWVHARDEMPVMVLVEDAAPASASHYVNLGAVCAEKPAGPAEVTRWLETFER